MKRYSAFLVLPAIVLLFACGQARKPAAPTASAEPPPAADGAVPPPPPADGPNVAGGPGGGPGGPGGPGRMMRSPEERVQEMQTALGLSQDQASQILGIIKQNQPAMDALRNNQSLSRDERRTQRDVLRQQMDAQITPLLTPEQKDKWEQLRAERRAQMGSRMGGGQGGNPPPPPAGGGQ